MRSEPSFVTKLLANDTGHEAHFSLGPAKMDVIIARERMEVCAK